MFCPVCKSEYRQSFTRCAACDVDLILSLEDPAEASEEVQPVLLWSGSEPLILARMVCLLQDSGIPFQENSTPAGAWVTSTLRPLEIWVTPSGLEAAQDLVAPVLESHPVETPSADGDAEEASAEIWSGEDVSNRIKGQTPETAGPVNCPYCGKTVVSFHDCPSLGGKAAFRYLQEDEKANLYEFLLQKVLLFGGLTGLVCGISLFRTFQMIDEEVTFFIVFGGIVLLGLIFLISTAITTWKERQEISKGLVTILEGSISGHWVDSPDDVSHHYIEVLGQVHEFDEGFWDTLKEGDTIRIEQLPRSRILISAEASRVEAKIRRWTW